MTETGLDSLVVAPQMVENLLLRYPKVHRRHHNREYCKVGKTN
jgi:hypothetical protein